MNSKHNPFSKLFTDSIAFAIGNIGSKLIVFLMFPLYTYYLTSAEYGMTDIAQTVVNLLLPVVYLSISDAVLRFTLDESSDKVKVFSSSLFFTLLVSVIIFLLGIIGFLIKNQYAIYIALVLILQSFQSLLAAFLKGIGKTRAFAINGILLAGSTAILNILLLVILRMHIEGFFLSMIFGLVISDIFLWSRSNSSVWIKQTAWSVRELRQLLGFSLPLIPNAVAWWVTNAVNRFFILFFVGATANGIFAAANKIPSILTIIDAIFFQSWQISAISQYGKEGANRFYATIYAVYQKSFFILISGLLIASHLIVAILSPTYHSAIYLIPGLLITTLFSSFSGFLGQILIAAKDTAAIFTTTVVGAISNLFLDLILIHFFGVQGATISSAISFGIVWISREVLVRKYASLDTSITQYIFPFSALLFQIAFLFNHFLIGEILIFILFSGIYGRNFVILIKGPIKRLLNKYSREERK